MNLSAPTHTAPEMPLPSSEETGKIGIMHLKRFLHKALLKRANKPINVADDDKEWELDRTVLSVLGIGLEQGMSYVYRKTPGFTEFEEWVIQTAGMPNDTGNYIKKQPLSKR